MLRLATTLTVIGIFLITAQAATAQAEKPPKSLHAMARHVALHGGIRGSCWGCATPKMKYLSRKLVIERFSRAGSEAVRWALCVVNREAGFNPGAVNSSSGASGLFQFLGHSQYSSWRLTHDPVYQVWAAWDLSNGATVRSHWYGGGYSC